MSNNMKHGFTQTQRLELIQQYQTTKKRGDIQIELAEKWCCTPRTIRNYAAECGLSATASKRNAGKIMIYDIETSRVTAKLWGTGKQYVGHKSLKSDTTIISIAWKWYGEDKVYHLTWDKDHCDKAMMVKFLKEYNSASMVIGQNNNSFDNKLVNTRAAQHMLYVNMFVKSFDIYRQAKKAFRLQSCSMAFMAEKFGLTLKQSHEGIHMWDMIEDGTPVQQKEYLKKMVDYNVGDIVTTEELYQRLRPYFGVVSNVTPMIGAPKWACPDTGSHDVKLLNTTYTPQGTVQRIMLSNETNVQYKITNKQYMDYIERQMHQ